MDQTTPLGVDQGPMKLAVSVLVAFVAVFGCMVAIAVFGSINSEAEQAARADAVRAEQAQRQAERHEVLRAEIPGALERVRASTAEMTAKLDRGDYTEAVARLHADDAIVTEYKGLPSPPAELTTELTAWNAIAVRVRRVDEMIQQCSAARDALAGGARLRRDPIGADELYATAAAALTRAGEVPDDIRRLSRCPSVESVERARARIASAVTREVARRAEVQRRCGDAPTGRSFDGEVADTQSYAARGAYDPDSIDVESCTPPVLNDRTCWETECIVEGKNAFGMMITNRQRFYIANGDTYSSRTVR